MSNTGRIFIVILCKFQLQNNHQPFLTSYFKKHQYGSQQHGSQHRPVSQCIILRHCIVGGAYNNSKFYN